MINIIDIFSNIDNIIRITTFIFSISVIIEAIEIISLKKYYQKISVWDDDLIKLSNVSKSKLLSQLLNFNVFYKLIQLQLILSILIIFYPNLYFLLYIFIIKLLISIKWNGSFNGGSDSMGLMVCIGLIISFSNNIFYMSVNLQFAGIIYIFITLITSYFRAGLSKVKNNGWLSGSELIAFANNTIYKNNNFIIRLINLPIISKILSWTIIIWELVFVISVFNYDLAIIFILIGVVFHIMNYYVFGLNRFVFTWLATYPSLIYIVILLNK